MAKSMVRSYVVAPSCYDAIRPIDRHLFMLQVTLVDFDTDRWGIIWMGKRLSRGKRWDYEPLPSSKTDRWKKSHQFSLGEALALTEKLVDTMTVNGRTAEQTVAHYDGGAQG